MNEAERAVELRQTSGFRLLQNPNYFGNLSELDIEGLPDPVMKKVGDTTFEELTCIGYNPDTEMLTAIVRIKQGTGYSGGPCTDGSYEYVRFYLDYGDGVWIDHGSTGFNIHDLGYDDDLCYAVTIRLDPKRQTCCEDDPVLPTVRAVLSWNVEPPSNMPNWSPIWGNRRERAIQIDPRSSFFCHFIDIFEAPGIQKVDPTLLKTVKALFEDQPPAPKPVATVAELAEQDYKLEHKQGRGGDELQVLRHVYPAVVKLAADKTDISAYQALESLKPLEIDFSKFFDFFLEPDFNTGYEELHCVGLDRDLNYLHGIVEVKRSSGYSGGLCTQGSREYIAFYLDFGSGWEYQGTTWVNVHNVPVPEDGLWYQASLPVNLDEERKEWCKTGRARIRGVLSWAVPPVPNQPNHVPHWGDREDCWIEIEPLPEGVEHGQITPFLEAIGNMPVAKIDSAGFAKGESIGATYTADDSPFGGAILFSGHIAFPTSNSLEYRVMVKGPSDATAQPWTKKFNVWVTTISGGSIGFTQVEQTPAGDWFEYIPQTGPVFKSVAGNLLARFVTAEEGLHTIYIQVREAGTGFVLATSDIEAFYVDNTSPDVDVEITSGAGNCGKFGVGDVIEGTYSMSDLHSRSLSLVVTPSSEAAGGHLEFTSVLPAAAFPPPLPGPTASNALSYAANTLTTGGASGQWTLTTRGMEPCGYNIRIHGEDRTIVNSGHIGWEAGDIEGFCLD